MSDATDALAPGTFRTEAAVIEWYDDVEDEATRLTRSLPGRLEAQRTKDVVSRYLGPQSLDVLDVGGATGYYAAWLAEQGHRVHVVDPVAWHVRQAATIPGVTAAVGDARALDVDDATFDLTLGLGPLYHLESEEERVLALREMRRATRPGGVVLASAIGRYHMMSEFALLGDYAGELADRVDAVVATGLNEQRAVGFPIRRAHLAEELQTEAEAAGLLGVEVIGLEGPAGAGIAHVPARRADDVVAACARVAARLEADPRVRDTSAHLVAIGHVPVPD